MGPSCRGVSGCDSTERICGYQIRNPLCPSWRERCADRHASSRRATQYGANKEVRGVTRVVILGTAGIPPRDVLLEAFQQVMAHAQKGELHIATERVPLADIEKAWQRDQPGRRLVIITSQTA